MSYWPVHKWTLWILPRNIHRNRGMARGIAVACRIEEIEYKPKGGDAGSDSVGVPARAAEWAFLSCREIERKSSDRERRRKEGNRQARGKATGVAHPSSMKIARFTSPPCPCGIMDNVWNPPITIFALEACSRLEENNQAYLNAPARAHRVGHPTNRAFYRLPFLIVD